MATTAEIRKWLIDHGEQPNTKGALPARLVAKYDDAHGKSGPRLLPNPSDLDDMAPEDFGMVDVDVPPEREPPTGPDPVLPGPVPPEPEPEPGEDEPPAHMREGFQQRARRRRRPTPVLKPVKLTVAQRGDIEAKLSFALEIPGRIWQARDPVCGSVFIEQRPEIAAALLDIVVGSPELTAFFLGGGGQFMLALNLMATLWPVITIMMAHHVYHSIEAAPEAGESPDYRQYAA